MCGIFGYMSSSPLENKSLKDERFLTALDKLRHRGPDDSGLESFKIFSKNSLSPDLILGHTRLSIIDLSSGGHQPMHSIDGRYTLVFNGEIYNYKELRIELESLGYKFRTDSDTEVLLVFWQHWGLNSLSRLSGMFAFAVYDKFDNSLTLVRDAFGIKPLFYQNDSKGFKFASEISALLSLIEEVPDTNVQRAYDYLVLGDYDNNSETFYDGIHHLSPGHFLRVDLKTLKFKNPKCWWQPNTQQRSDLNFNSAAEELREIFLKNVKLHLRSDVPIGAALSGGIDSSAVVCAMRYLEPDMPLHTFSYIAQDSSINEEKWVDIINSHVGAIPHKIIINPEELSRDLEEMIFAQGEPFSSTSIYAHFRIFKAAKEAGIVVTLDGQGADELLAGYEGYPDSYLRSLLDKKEYLFAFNFLLNWSKWPGRGFIRAYLKLGSAVLKNPNFIRLARILIGESLSPSWVNKKYLKEKGVKKDFSNRMPSEAFKERRLIGRLLGALKGDGLSSLLRHGDRNSMYWSIESRVPFLTTELAEFILQLPEEYLISPKGQTKFIFREAMKGIVPDIVLHRKDKIGFKTPEDYWLQKNIKDIEKWLKETSLPNFLDKKNSITELNKLLKNPKSQDSKTWRLINFIFWEKSKNSFY